jgi:hypothetical protein
MIKYTNVEKKAHQLTTIQIMPSALTFFAKELNEAGGFDDLMIKKKALERINGSSFIITHNNIQEYKEKYLTEKYRPLRPYFNTKIPYSFWSQLYVALVERISSKK